MLQLRIMQCGFADAHSPSSMSKKQPLHNMSASQLPKLAHRHLSLRWCCTRATWISLLS